MKVLVFGSGGQLGWELIRTCPDGFRLLPRDYPAVDFLLPCSIKACIDETDPDLIINAAAYTAVDQAETDQDRAFQLNHLAVAEIAELAFEKNIGLVHISTDYVFNGSNHKPWHPQDKPDPKSVYGLSKLYGEAVVFNKLKEKSLIIRTAWLYSSHGKNFVKTMLGAMAAGKCLKIIDEQIGTPTWGNGLAKAIWTCIEKRISGVHHWTDSGVASWYDFAVAIQEEAISLGIIKQWVDIRPVTSEQFATTAHRPFYSVLDKGSLWKESGIIPVHWRVQLRYMLREMIG